MEKRTRINKNPQPKSRAISQIVFEKLLDEQYSKMSLEDVIAELGYMTDRNRTELSAQKANLIRSFEHKRIGQFILRHDRPKFKAMYREWKSQQPIIPL